jgi:hypothetical protein
MQPHFVLLYTLYGAECLQERSSEIYAETCQEDTQPDALARADQSAEAVAPFAPETDGWALPWTFSSS